MADNFFARRGAAYINELRRSCGALLGIAQGVLSDRQLVDAEIVFLDQWLNQNDAIANEWPGDVLHERIRAALADGMITEDERRHLVETLQQLIGGSYDELASPAHVTRSLAFDDVAQMEFSGSRFCLTGEFAFAPRSKCEAAISSRGGIISSSVTKKLHYLVVGGLGSPEWKHGSFGTKIEHAVKNRREGLPVLIVHEDRWASFLRAD